MSELLGNKFIGNGRLMDVTVYEHFGELAESQPSVYEVIRVEEGIPLFFEDYMKRLENSFHLLNRDLPLSIDQIAAGIHMLVKVNAHKSGPVKLIFAAGDLQFSIFFIMKPHLPRAEEYVTGVKTVFMHETRSNPNLKMWNRGLRDRSVDLLSKTSAYEAVLVNEEGLITEASRSNVFFIHGHDVFTSGDDLVLPGITRKKVLEVCHQLDTPVHFTSLPSASVGEYDSCFLTGTARKIVPVRMIGEHHFQVDTPMLRKISEGFETYVSQYLEGHL